MRYSFDEFELDCEKRELLHDGMTVAVEPQVFRLIVHLIEHRDRVVSKEELVEAIWHGRFVSDSAVSSRVKSARKALGDSGQAQKYIKTIHGCGFRFAGPDVGIERNPNTEASAGLLNSAMADHVFQDIRFCTSKDGTKIAYATAGDGLPLVKTANWLNHLEHDWHSPVWQHVFSDLMSGHQLIRYDARGNGLSDWTVHDFSFDRQLEDLEAAIDAIGVSKFPLLGISQGCAISVAYAAKHPDRVTKLVLLGGYTCGWRHRATEDMIREDEALMSLIRVGWGRNHTAFRQTFTSLFMPDAPAENQEWFNELQRKTTSPENAANLLDALGNVDVRDLLHTVQCQALVLHCRGDMRVPLDEGRQLAAGIPEARFMTLNTRNHLMPKTDPAWNECSAAIRSFLAE